MSLGVYSVPDRLDVMNMEGKQFEESPLPESDSSHSRKELAKSQTVSACAFSGN